MAQDESVGLYDEGEGEIHKFYENKMNYKLTKTMIEWRELCTVIKNAEQIYECKM